MLSISDLVVRYGKVDAIDGLSIHIDAGQIVALIGNNGAGKSSLLHAIAGAVRPASGDVRLDGETLLGLASHAVVRRGVVLVPEGRMIFATLTVRENLLVGAHALGSRSAAAARAKEVVAMFPRLGARLDSSAAALSGGERQVLAIARGLMARPRLVMLDEPSLGLSPLAAQETFKLIARLRDQGMAVLLVEQNVRQALAIADRGYVLQHGRIVLEGPAKGLMGHDLLLKAYLGVKTEEMPT